MTKSLTRYSNPHITEPVRVCVELVRPSDNSRSEEKEFFFTPSPGQVKCENSEITEPDTITSMNVHNGWGFVTEIKSESEEMTNKASEMTSSSDHQDLIDEEPSESPGDPYHIQEPVPEEKIEQVSGFTLPVFHIMMMMLFIRLYHRVVSWLRNFFSKSS